MDTLWNRFVTRWKRKERSWLSGRRRNYHNNCLASQGQAVVRCNIERKKDAGWDKRTSRIFSKIAVQRRKYHIWQRKFKRSSVFRQANIEKTLKNRGKGTETTLKRTGVNVWRQNYEETAKIEKNLGNRAWCDACWLWFGLWGYLVTTITSHHNKKSTGLVMVSLADSTDDCTGIHTGNDAS